MLATSAPSSFITLTPRGDDDGTSTEAAKAAGSLPDRPRMGSSQRPLVRSKTTPEHHDKAPGATGLHTNHSSTATSEGGKKAPETASGSPTDTEQSSEDGMSDAGGGDVTTEFEFENEFGVFPAYVCELHDPKEVLEAANVVPDRVEIQAVNPPPVEEYRDKRNWRWSSNNTFCYEITVGATSSRFECSPAKVLQAFQELANDPTTRPLLRMIETDYFRNGIVGSFKRLYPSAVKLCTEIVELLSTIADIDVVLLHPAFLNLVEIEPGQAIFEELESLVHWHQHGETTSRNSEAKCMCEVYVNSVDRFADLYKPPIAETPVTRYSVVASESLMQARTMLSFFSDTVYILDKRDFRPFRGLNKCNIYGFGRRKIFVIVQTSRKQWSFRHSNLGTIATLTLEHYLHNMNPYSMVAVRRVLPGSTDLSTMKPLEEEVCYVRRSRKKGFRCMLMSEVISCGRVTTALNLDYSSVVGDDGRTVLTHSYKTMSEVSDLTRESLCSSLLTVSGNPRKHFQQVRISSGSDIVTFLALAACYDILASPLVYMTERRY